MRLTKIKYPVISGVVLVFILAIVSVIAGVVMYSKESSPSYACKVIDKSVHPQEDGSTQYRIYTENCDVFQISDDPMHGQFNSASLYGKITVGKSYKIISYGPRNGFLSLFPNINQATEVN